VAIVDYASLQTTVAQFMNRGDLLTIPAGNTTNPIQDGITLCEAKIQRKLRRVTVRATITLGAEQCQLPSDCKELRSIRLITGDPTNDSDITIVTPTTLADYRAMYADVAGRPRYASVISGGNIILVPPPDSTYTADITYYQFLVPLSATNTTNLIFTESPDLYLYGTLAEMETYMEHDERLPLWQQRFQDALDDLEIVKEREELGAGTRLPRLPYNGFTVPW